MYEVFFKLHGRPFHAAPRPDRYFPATVIENARQTLCRAIERSEGPGLIVGPAGTGKTLLCQMLVEEFEDRFAVALLASGRLGTRQALLQAILYELGLPYKQLNEGELRLSLLDFLQPKPEGPSGLLLVLDEAHALPGRLLEEVRMLTNLVRDGESRVRVVLAGGPTLEERFAHPNLNSFAQRLAARCYLESLDSSETAEYVRAQIEGVGRKAAELFDVDALRAVYRATDGVPRLINQVCDHALILASLGGLKRLTAEAIDEAWADLQQLPAPWTAGHAEPRTDQVVEFGNLDEAPDESPDAIPFRAPAPQRRTSNEPAEQLEVIAEQLSKIDDTFQPAGSIGTEVEIDFPEFGDPFGEEFAEEEVVIERYRPDEAAFAAAQRVSSWEGHQLGSLLRPLDLVGPSKSQPAQSNEMGSPASISAAAPAEQASAPSVAASVEQSIAAVRVESPSVVASRQAQASSVIVVEEEGPLGPVPPRPIEDARKLEYRRLFAKLRRG